VVGAGTFAVMKSQQEAIEKAADERAISVIEKRASTDLVQHRQEPTNWHHAARHRQGRDPKLAEQVEGVLKAADAKIAKGALFTEVGKSSHRSRWSAPPRPDRKPGPGGSRQGRPEEHLQGARPIRKANPELAKQEETERKGNKAA
jgi:hypothetical protein